MGKKKSQAQDDYSVPPGTMPESWLCVDCSINTAPGCPNRAETEQAFRTEVLTGKEGCEMRIDEWSEVYTVRAAVWAKAGMKPMDGCLCIGCLEQRLGRRLTPNDFSRKHPFNQLPGTERLLDRQGRTDPLA